MTRRDVVRRRRVSRMDRFARGLVVAAALALVVAGCGGDDGGGGEGDADDSSRCLPVDEAVLDMIASEPKGVEIVPEDGAAVLSEDFQNDVYFIAMEFTAPGFEGDSEVGIWATTHLEGAETGPMFAVDGFATEFTSWRDGAEKGLTSADDGVDEAEECLG